MAASLSISSSVIANSIACRHLAMMPLLVRSDTNKESTNEPPGSIPALPPPQAECIARTIDLHQIFSCQSTYDPVWPNPRRTR
jgi:hypothetical protein